MKTVLTIAGFDPSSGAGVTADLMVFAAHGLFGTAAITALTVQSTLGVGACHPVGGEVLEDTLQHLAADLPPTGIKIGMIGSADNLFVISRYISQLKVHHIEQAPVPVVLDPVLASSSGRELLDAEGLDALQAELLPLVDWITPNMEELAALTGLPVRAKEDLSGAARELQRRSSVGRRGEPLGVLAKGGHLEQPDDLVLMPEGEEHWLPGKRIATDATHGTGCALSSAFLSRLVLGDAPADAARKAKEYVAEAMRRAPGIGRGKGPMGLRWPFYGEQDR